MEIFIPRRLYGTSYLDIPYATEGLNHASQKLDVLLPWSGGTSPWPVVMVLHPGGWKSGDKALPGNTHPFTDPRASGIAVVTINYRLSTTHVWPAPIHDAKAALRWINVHGWKYHLDPTRIGVWGLSAGGHLAALLAMTTQNTALSGSQGNATGRERVKCCIGWWTPTLFTEEDADFAFQGTPNGRGFAICSTSSQEAELFGGSGAGLNPCSGGGLTKSTEASPRTYATRYAPPCRWEHGDADDTIPYKQSENMHTLLSGLGVTSSFHLRAGYGHGTNLGWNADSATRAAQVTFLQTHL